MLGTWTPEALLNTIWFSNIYCDSVPKLPQHATILAGVEKLDEAESTGILFEAAQLGTVELDTAILGAVELDKGEIDAVTFGERNW